MSLESGVAVDATVASKVVLEGANVESTMASTAASTTGAEQFLVKGLCRKSIGPRPSLTFFPRSHTTGRQSPRPASLDEWIPASASFVAHTGSTFPDKPRLSAHTNSTFLDKSRLSLGPSTEIPTFSLVEAFFVVDLNLSDFHSTSSLPSQSTPVVAHSWPSSMAASCLAQRCSEMCNPYVEHQKSDCFVFAVLESVVREVSIFQGSNQYGCTHLYGCAVIDDRKGLILISAIPIFEVFFTILKVFLQFIMSNGQDGYDWLNIVLSKLNRRGLCRRVLKGFQTSGAVFQPSFKVHEPAEDILAHLARAAVERHSEEEKVMMRWISEWALRRLLQNRDLHSLFGEKLAFLIASVLLEQSIVLVGPKDLASALALALVSLVWPFRWLHMFLPVATPSLESIPLFEAPVPFLVATTYIPHAWIEEPSGQSVVCFHLEDGSSTSADQLTVQDESMPQLHGYDEFLQLPGHDDFSRKLELVIEQVLKTGGEPTDEELTTAVDGIITVCREKIDELVSALEFLAKSNESSSPGFFLSSAAYLDPSFLSSMLDTQMGVDYKKASTPTRTADPFYEEASEEGTCQNKVCKTLRGDGCQHQ